MNARKTTSTNTLSLAQQARTGRKLWTRGATIAVSVLAVLSLAMGAVLADVYSHGTTVNVATPSNYVATGSSSGNFPTPPSGTISSTSVACSAASLAVLTTTVVLNATTANENICTAGTSQWAIVFSFTTSASTAAGTTTFTFGITWQAMNAAGTAGINYPLGAPTLETLTESMALAGGSATNSQVVSFYLVTGSAAGPWDVTSLTIGVTGA